MISKEELKSYFRETKDTKDGGFDCLCNCHNDHNPSFHWKMGNKGWIGKCLACQAKGADAARVAGINVYDLFADSKPRTEYRMSSQQYGYEKNCIDKYPYFRIDSELLTHIKYRMPNHKDGRKNMPQGYDKDGKWVRGTSDIDTSLSLFCNVSVSKLKENAKNNKIVGYFEGEKDCKTGGKYGLIGFTLGGTNNWESRKGVFKYLNNTTLVIFGDNDTDGIRSANEIASYYKQLGGNAVVIIPPNVPEHGDITDYMQDHTQNDFNILIDEALKNSVTENRVDRCLTKCHTPEEVKELLSYSISQDKDGNMKSRKIIQSVRNNEIILENDRRFAGRLCFNEFSRQDYLIGSVPWDTSDNYRAWNSHDDSALFSIIQSDYGMNNRQDYFDAVKNVSMKFKFHPVKDILDGLEWDGKEHIRNLLPDYLGAESTEYTYEVMKLFMLGAVSRIYQPGCKFDYTLILQGKQGIGKSTFLQMLALSSEWFNDSMDSLDSDKSAQALSGTWIVEFGELKALARTSGGVDSVKRFLSATQDKLRLPYERRCDIFLRQCVFTGTTNKSDFLQDETGNRRFLIIHTGVNKPNKNLFNLSAMDDIKQAWAEVMHIYRTEKPQLVLSDSFKEEAEQLQANSTVDDGKTGIIEEYLKDKDRTCALEIWQEALHEQGRPVRWQATEINSIIDSFPDWERMNTPYKFTKYGNQRGFKRVQSSSEFVECTQEEIEQLPFS